MPPLVFARNEACAFFCKLSQGYQGPPRKMKGETTRIKKQARKVYFTEGVSDLYVRNGSKREIKKVAIGNDPAPLGTWIFVLMLHLWRLGLRTRIEGTIGYFSNRYASRQGLVSALAIDPGPDHLSHLLPSVWCLFWSLPLFNASACAYRFSSRRVFSPLFFNRLQFLYFPFLIMSIIS